MVARYNPCGRVVEIGQNTGITYARLYPDSDELFEIEWYEALDSAPLLGCPSAVNSLAWEIDREEWLITAVGEVWGEPWTQTPTQKKALADGSHRCGTPEDFAGRGKIDLVSPPVKYRPDGLPECCGLLFEGEGGAVGGGTATVVYPWIGTGGAVGGGSASVAYVPIGTGGGVGGGSAPFGIAYIAEGGGVGGGEASVYFGPIITGEGGAVGGGTADAFLETIITGEGGAVGGGTATVSFIPPSPPPGTTCATALTGVHGSGVLYNITALTNLWIKWTGAAATLYTINISFVSGTCSWQIWHGSSCASLVFVTSGTGSGVPTYFSGIVEPFWLQFTGGGGNSSAIVTVTP